MGKRRLISRGEAFASLGNEHIYTNLWLMLRTYMVLCPNAFVEHPCLYNR